MSVPSEPITGSLLSEGSKARPSAQGQVASYALARGIPGVINLISLGLYTRLLGPEAFGEYALTISAISLVSTVAFYWLEIGLVRFYPQASSEALLPTILRAFLWASFVSVVFAASLALWGDGSKVLLLAGLALLVSQAWHGLQLQLARSIMSPRLFARMSIARAVLAPFFGSILVLLGMGSIGLLLGLSIGALLPSLRGLKPTWLPAIRARPSPATARALVSYGAPLALMFGLRFIVNSSDRFMIAHFLGTHDAGIYSAATDLAGNSLGFLTNIVQLAAFPMIVRAFEHGGSKDVEETYQTNMSLLLTLTLPATVGLSMLAPQVSNAFFPQEFRSETAVLIPWIATGTLVAMLKGVGFDVAFHLTKRTTLQLCVVLLAAIANVLLNLFLIPSYGVLGAAQATLLTHGLALGVSVVLGRRFIRLPFPFANAIRLIGAAAVMGLSLVPTLAWQGKLALGLQVLLGMMVFLLASAMFGVEPIRAILMRPLLALRGQNER